MREDFMLRNRWLGNRWLAILATLTLVLAACGGATDSDDADDGSDGDSTSIDVSGSSTVEPITARVAEAFQGDNPEAAIAVEGPGTGDGFQRFCKGETDISDASRAIKDSEAETCAENDINYVELHIATDGISVITSPDNDAVSCLDFNDLYALVGPESEGFETWADASDLGAELGGIHAPYPDAPLVITAPGEESGTYDTFVELVLEDLAEERGAEGAARADYQASPNDNVIVQGVSGNATSLGWVGFAFFEENADALKALEVDGGDGCVVPTADTIASFEYPLSRPLFIYVNTDKAAEKPLLAQFIDYFLSDTGLEAVSAAGYVQLPAADIEATRAAWDGR